MIRIKMKKKQNWSLLGASLATMSSLIETAQQVFKSNGKKLIT